MKVFVCTHVFLSNVFPIHIFSQHVFLIHPSIPPAEKNNMDPHKNYAVADEFLVQQRCDFQVLCVGFTGEYTPVELVHPIRYPFFLLVSKFLQVDMTRHVM